MRGRLSPRAISPYGNPPNQCLIEIEGFEFAAPISGQTIPRLVGPKLIKVWIGGVKALDDALDQLGPLNRWEQTRLLGQQFMRSFMSSKIAGESDGLETGAAE